MHQISLILVMLGFTTSLAGQALNWTARLGGTNYDNAFDMEVDPNGRVYACGFFEGSGDFNPGPGTATLTSNGDADVYVSSLLPDGTFAWAKSMGGAGEDYAEGIAIDKQKNVYIAGYFNGMSDFDPGFSFFYLTSAGNYDAYVVKLDSNGVFVWAKRFGGTNHDQARSVVVDTAGNIIVGGLFNGSGDFNPGTGTSTLTSKGGNDIFFVKLDQDGNFIWARSIGGSGDDQSRHITIDTHNYMVSTGRFSGTVDFNAGGGVANLISAGMSDAYVLRLDASGNYVWALRFGGANTDEGNAILTDTSGNIFTTGFFQGTVDFDPGAGTSNLVSAGAEDIFISKIDSSGVFIQAHRIGGTGLEKAHSMVLDTTGDLYISGYFSNAADFDPGPGSATLVSAGGLDAFICKLTSNGSFIWTRQLTGPEDVRIHGMGVSRTLDVVVHGYFSGTVDFNPDTAVLNIAASGNTDCFIVSLGQCLPSGSSMDVTACNQYLSPDGMTVWNASGQYADTLINTAGCDSIITISLTIVQNTSAQLVVSACDAYVSPSSEEVWTQSGTYLDTLQNAMMCDSMVTVELTILESSTLDTTLMVCDPYTAPDGQVIMTSGAYQFMIPNSAGCDSNISVDLTIIELNTDVIQDENQLTAGLDSASYQWVDCDQGWAPLSGETSQLFVASINGNYAVIIGADGCLDTSACYTVNQVGEENLILRDELRLYPNPSSGSFIIEPGILGEAGVIAILDPEGRALFSMDYKGQERITVPFTGLPGIYFVRLNSKTGSWIAKMMIQ